MRFMPMATDPCVRGTDAERRRTADNAIASARLEGLDASSLNSAIEAYVRGESTIDELIAEALGSAAGQPSVG